jgi:hypothetical protein
MLTAWAVVPGNHMFDITESDATPTLDVEIPLA